MSSVIAEGTTLNFIFDDFLIRQSCIVILSLRVFQYSAVREKRCKAGMGYCKGKGMAKTPRALVKLHFMFLQAGCLLCSYIMYVTNGHKINSS